MGSKCGLGQLIDETGNSFDGIFVDDNLNGDGKYTNASTREEIEGKFVNYKLEGKGFWRDQLGAIYDGEFVHNIKHGIGTLYAGCENGDTSTGRALYSGEWREGRPCGRGVLNLVVEAEGSGGLMISAQYTGDIVDGYPHGEGECIYSDGCQYVGQWRKSFRNGFGKYRSSNGDEYDGKWVADKRCGKGVWKSYRGDRYTGQWEANVPHGHGEFCYASGAVFNGGWVYGKCEGEGKMIYTDTSEFNGLWKSGAWHGHGSWRGPARSDGEVSYTGEWVNDVRNGQGVATYASGDKYKGIFLNDRPNPN